MRQPQNAKRGRGRGRRSNGNPQPHVPNRNTSYESNGPEVKLRGNAQQLNEKYLALAHDAAAAGERITAEAYTQFADHYFRLHQAAVDAAEERRAQHAERQPRSDQSRSESPQPTIEDGAAETAEASGNGAAEKDDAAAGNAEVVDLSPAKLSEIVQEEQDSASA
ncbi:MAG TPA: DUF4167 domain-containing protein [Alphaproteobacteria bacterium]|jgi:hypothetical protein|nr:MAG: hypothetical protein CNE93_04430 [SAR116 cluster bacterium MED-G06]RPG87932.1 MAG: DUF4167 domain-containing protein [Candidatus Puniceispirillum sp. TMED245]HCV88395.1 DUF4167 domain-containing protein [Alphaproteobacteria bacterium]